ncbi:MAG: hypothetical protein KF763_18000 [Cyclobacteriaceae bacterium]|nr:hypothetical protein [Cyclobacteriaceae bacterium]
MKSISVILFFLYLVPPDPEKEIASWSFRFSEPVANAETELIFSASIKKNWYLYSSDVSEELGPIPTHIEWIVDDSYLVLEKLQPINASKKYDPTWEADITYFSAKAEFRQRIKILKDKPVIRGIISGQYCNAKDGQCIPFRETFQL